MTRFFFLLILLLQSLGTLVAQQSIVTVLDPENKPLPYVHLHLLASGEYLLTDHDGKTIVEFNGQDSLAVEISCIGFVTINQILYPNKDIEFILKSAIVTINDAVVTGQYSENSPEKAVQKITIIDAKKIENMAAVTLRDVLTNEMSIRLSQDNILGSGLSLQGISGENVKILIDGVPVIGRLGGNVDLSQINLNNIERIEIVEGPMSVNYGTNALAGVINLITKKGIDKNISLTLNSYYENIGQYNLDGAANFSFKKHSVAITGGRNYFDGWIDGDQTFGEQERIADSTRYKSWKPKEQLFGGLSYSYKLKNGQLKYALNLFDEQVTNRGLPRAPYGESAFDDFYNTKRIDNALFYNTTINNTNHLKATVAYNDYQRIKNTYFRNLTSLDDVLTSNEGDQDTTSFSQWMIRSSFATAKDSVKFNYEVGLDLNYSEAVGRRIQSQSQSLGDYAIFVSGEYKPFDNLILRPGLRYGYNTSYNAPITPSINLKYKFKNFNTRFSYAKGFRSPSLKELYFDFVDINHNIVGNINLEAEESHNFNFSTNYTKLIENYLLKMEVSAFYNSISNMITLAQEGSGVSFSYINIGNYETRGIQLNNNISYKHFKFGIGASYIGRSNFMTDDRSVIEINYSPEVKSNMSYDFHKSKIFVSVFYKYSGKLPGFRLEDENVVQTFIDDYHIADLSIGKKMMKDRMKIIVGSKNLLNVKNVSSVASASSHAGAETSSPVAMGRTYFVKLSFKFDHTIKTKTVLQ